MNWKSLPTAGAALLFLIQPAAAGQPAAGDQPDRRWSYTPTQANTEARRWFQDAKFGVFLHWGLYSQLAGAGSEGLAEWIMHEKKIPASKYERLAEFFNPTQFDANEWVRSFKGAGARYIVITSKHHDGFAMFDSKVSSFDVVDSTPFKRDPIKELAEAAQRHGLKLFFYYSQLDWRHPDYYPRGKTGRFSGRPEQGQWERYLAYQDAQVRELLTQYGPIGGIWFDGWWDHEETQQRNRWNLARTYRMIHDIQPATLIASNHHQTPFPGEDYQAFERDLPGENSMGFNAAGVSRLPLEMAETMNGSWGFSLTDDRTDPAPAVGRHDRWKRRHRLSPLAGLDARAPLHSAPRPLFPCNSPGRRSPDAFSQARRRY